MGYMKEYLKFSVLDLEEELTKLIIKYNKIRDTYLIIYASDLQKSIPDNSMTRDDYYTFFDMLNSSESKTIDVLLETPGGSGDAAEEIGNFLHDKFEKVSYVITGEAKSAGTILALSGNDILMTKTGSMGPIDAQVKIGRTVISAYDYVSWVKGKKKEAGEKKGLNPVDAVMIAQISPGELCSVYHALKFAEDLAIKWLPKYKFENWTVTSTQGMEVTDQMKLDRAKEIAQKLTNHADWRSHGRSIKIEDLEDNLKLQIIPIDDDKELAEIVYRTHSVLRMIFSRSTIYKVFFTADERFKKVAVQKNSFNEKIPLDKSDLVEFEIICSSCGKKHSLYAKFKKYIKIEKDLKKHHKIPFPKNNKLVCDCGFEIDLNGIKNQIETDSGQKIVFDK